MRQTPLYQLPVEKTIHCPQCGDTLDIHFRWTKLILCNSCSSTLFLNDESVERIGEASTLSPEPSLIQLQHPFTLKKRSYTPLGKIRYSYGRGFWEEWYLRGGDNKAYWLSIDEGDLVLEEKTSIALPFQNPSIVNVGQVYGNYTVTEKGKGVCVGFEGELPENIYIGETHNYIHLSSGGGNLVTVEYSDKERKSFKGEWIDPLDIKVFR